MKSAPQPPSSPMRLKRRWPPSTRATTNIPARTQARGNLATGSRRLPNRRRLMLYKTPRTASPKPSGRSARMPSRSRAKRRWRTSRSAKVSKPPRSSATNRSRRWSPINSQAKASHRDKVKSLVKARQGEPDQGEHGQSRTTRAARYGDRSQFARGHRRADRRRASQCRSRPSCSAKATNPAKPLNQAKRRTGSRQ